MVVLLDTRAVSRSDRAATVNAALNSATSPTQVSLDPHTQASISAWPCDEHVSFIDSSFITRSLRVSRTSQHVRQSGMERLSVAYNLTGSCVTTNHGREELRNDHLRLTDTTAPYGIVWRGNCRAVACEVDYRRLGVSIGFVRAVMPALASSPLHDLLRHHLLHLSRVADALSPQALAATGASTAGLVRAALLSVSPRDQHRREATADTLLLRIEDFIRRHLDDPDLDPTAIAAAHNISLRHLYAMFADRDETPSEWIMVLRLEAARAELSCGTSHISATGQRWGFKTASHFSRRFKAAYGMTPREWRLQFVEPPG